MPYLSRLDVLLAAASLLAHASPAKFEAGQEWRSRTRLQDLDWQLSTECVNRLEYDQVHHVRAVAVHFFEPQPKEAGLCQVASGHRNADA